VRGRAGAAPAEIPLEALQGAEVVADSSVMSLGVPSLVERAARAATPP